MYEMKINVLLLYLNCCFVDEKIIIKVGFADFGPKECNTELYRISVWPPTNPTKHIFCKGLLRWMSPGYITIRPRKNNN